MAKEYPGLILRIAAAIRTAGAREALVKRGTFKNHGVLRDWQTLLETMLQWEMWLKSDQMEIKHVNASFHFHRYVMWLIKNTCDRKEGMGLNTTKFHTIMHYSQDMKNNGVPGEYDTGANESGHKQSKMAAKLTQKKHSTFDKQVATRLEEAHVLDLATEELAGRPLWEYELHEDYDLPHKEKRQFTGVGGARIMAYYDEDKQENCAALRSKTLGGAMNLENTLVDFLAGLSVASRSSPLPRLTTPNRCGSTMFMPMPSYGCQNIKLKSSFLDSVCLTISSAGIII